MLSIFVVTSDRIESVPYKEFFNVSEIDNENFEIAGIFIESSLLTSSFGFETRRESSA
jgi:hypothetical protein